ncbi:MAG: Leucine-rich repeat (LRR) protein [Saprospiraceae bacterium]|jgi:Leucine-rich repeat (LRR) protein
MKKGIYIIFCLFFASIVSAQDLSYETEVLEKYSQQYSQQYQKKFSVSDISGICDAVTINTAQGVIAGWDGCEGTVYEGTVEFELTTEYLYDVFTISENGNRFNDQSFGAYYACYGTESQGSMPNSDAYFPTLFFEVTEQGDIRFSGSSQWGEVYFISDVTIDGSMLYFQWINDYGEGASVQLVRQDGQLWEELLAPSPGCAICSETDSLALIALYNSTNGAEWYIPWDLTTPVRNWYGVTLNDDCCVAEIDMGFSSELSALGEYHNNLVGELPDEMSNLSSLEVLSLSDNKISGDALSKIANLSELRNINIVGNQVSGAIPSEAGSFPKLELLYIYNNDITGEIPAEFGNLENLKYFFCYNNQLEGEIPSELGNSQSLINFSCSYNQLEGELPKELSNISTLENFFANDNNITGEIPAEYGSFQNLAVFSAWGNSLTGIIPQMQTLQHLYLGFNQLEGEIPMGMTNISVLSLNDNNLSGEIPDDLSSALNGSPGFINLSHNNFSGSIRSSLIREDGWQGLFLNDNNFESCVGNIDALCMNMFSTELDTLFGQDTFYISQLKGGYNLLNNSKLPWEGNLQIACYGSNQIGAPCNDGNPDTGNDGIDEDCNCSENSVATQEISQIESLSINPNPIRSGERVVVSLDLNQSVSMHAQLIDITGKVISAKQIHATEGRNEFIIDSQSLDVGLYFLQLSSKNGVTTKKVVIQ